MIIGNGVDIVEIKRIADIIKEKPRFLERNFTLKERDYFHQKKMRAESIAANFAAKEAVSKAFGTGIRGFNFIDIEVLRDELGKPYVNLYGGAQSKADALGIESLMLSLSHSENMAIAFVVAIGRN